MFKNNAADQFGGAILINSMAQTVPKVRVSVLHFLGGRNKFEGNSGNPGCQTICRRGDTGDGSGSAVNSKVFFDICPPNTWYNEDLLSTGTSVTKGIGINFEGCPQPCPSNKVAPDFASRSNANVNTVCSLCPAGKTYCTAGNTGCNPNYDDCRK